jgi:hypothetical protein
MALAGWPAVVMLEVAALLEVVGMAHDDGFNEWRGARPEVRIGENIHRLPVSYHDTDGFTAVHPASYQAVRAELPSDAIEPLRWVDGRALVAITAWRFKATTWSASDGPVSTLTPYGEISVAAVVTRGPAPRVLPFIRGEQRAFILHLPVTTSEACDGGRQIWGLPKFVADMDFVEEPSSRRVELSEAGSTILILTVRPGGPVLPDRRSFVVYSALNGELLETVMPVRCFVQTRMGSRAGELALGAHPVAARLRQLEISPQPALAFNYLRHRSILPAGTPIGAAKTYQGYTGTERQLGRFTVTYPGTEPLDQYAALRKSLA